MHAFPRGAYLDGAAEHMAPQADISPSHQRAANERAAMRRNTLPTEPSAECGLRQTCPGCTGGGCQASASSNCEILKQNGDDKPRSIRAQPNTN